MTTSPVHDGLYSFTFTYTWHTLHQEVDLLGKGYSATYLDTSPDVFVEDHVIAFFNSLDHYRLKVELRDSSHTALATFDTGEQDVTSNTEWTKISTTFSDYPTGVRYIYYERSGIDSEFWAGAYGPAFDNAILTVYEPVTPVPTKKPKVTYSSPTSTVTPTITPTASPTSTPTAEPTRLPVARSSDIPLQDLPETGGAVAGEGIAAGWYCLIALALAGLAGGGYWWYVRKRKG